MSQDIDARRSTAAQFFMEDESEEQKSSYNKIVDWLNSASVANENKVDYLWKVQEIIINKEESLLDNFLEEVLGFQNDRNQEVRKFMVGFIEEACKKDPDVLPRVVTNLAMLLKDQSVKVLKRIVQAACSIYRSALEWLAHARTVSDEMETTWNIICAIKGEIFGLVDSDNDGLRTQAIKFLECVVLMQTYPEADSFRRDNDFSLEDVPLTLKIARRRKLEEEAHMVFELMLKFHGSMHISSVNLMTCMGSIVLIAKMRPQFMGKVVTALETLNANLPPTLSKSQVSSVRKHLKLQLLNLLRLSSSVAFHNNITTMLTDLGASTQEVMRCLPRMDELRRRQKRLAAVAAAKAEANATASSLGSSVGPTIAKRPRMDAAATAAAAVEDDDYDEDDDDDASNHVGSLGMSMSSENARSRGGDRSEEGQRSMRPATEQAVDITEQFIVERLAPEMAAQLVMVSMAKLPDTMPPHFSSMYTPIAAAGTHSQIRHVARLMATQFTALGLGPGYSQQLVKSAVKGSLMEEEDEDLPGSGTKASIASALSGIIEKDKEAVKASALTQGSSKLSKQRIRTLKLSEITKPMEREDRNLMMGAAIRRILKSEKHALLGGVASVRNKIITTVAATYNELVRCEVLKFLLEDIRNRLELALAWLYEEYAFLQGFNRMPAFLRPDPEGPERSYNDLLCAVARNLIDKADARDRDVLLSRLFLEAPLITEEATDLLRAMCLEESRSPVGLALLKELVIRRPPRQLVFLNALLVHTAHENSEIRSKAISFVVTLYDRGDLRCIIEEYAILYLGFLRLPAPPDVLFGFERGRPTREQAIAVAASGQVGIGPDGLPVTSSGWTEEMVRACLYLYLALLPVNEKLIHELARVYVTTVADVKRTILRLLEQPVRGMGMDSPELLRLVEECPKGAETLVTRVIHILTDKTPPSAELVARVRDLYHSRVADVRFLIPVLNGLTKKEVIAALPKLIKLNPVVVKEVFNRLLGTHNEASSHTSPLTPAELLIALHTIDPSKCELKTVIKATSLCFAERQAYTQEVLAVVMQHLMELNPLPTLLMRTVIQALSFYPRLIGFVMNILQRLILKQVWKQRKVWEGFVKCCQRTRPQSFQVLLQLPPAQLCDVFEASPDLRAPLLQHVMSFTENQRAHIPPSIMDVLLGKRRSISEEYDEQVEPRSPSELTIDIKEEPESEPAPPGLD